MRKKFIILNLFSILFLSCRLNEPANDSIDPVYRQYMREFVQNLSNYAKTTQSKPDFLIIPQNGNELLTMDGEKNGAPSNDYLNAIDGIGREDLFYGYYYDDIATPAVARDYMMAFLDIARANDIEVLVIDYCRTQAIVDDSYLKNFNKGYISFAADQRELNSIPAYPGQPYNENTGDVVNLSDAKNFLYLINPDSFASKITFIDSLKNTNYDIILIDLFYLGTEPAHSDILSLKTKANGGTRLVIAYMSIGEAEDYRYYWSSSWNANPPSWLSGENPDWPGNYKVKYWDPQWQAIIYGNDGSYLKKIIDAGFDGVYLDIIDAFEYFE